MSKEINIENLVSWIKSYAASRNKSALLVEIDGTIPCLANVFLAKKTGLPLHAIVNSNNKNYNLSRDFCEHQHINFSRIHTDIYLSDWMPEIDSFDDNRISYKNDEVLATSLEMIAKVAYIAETTNSLVLSNITRDDYLFVRNYPKLNAWDIMPFANYPLSDINKLFNILIPVKNDYIENIIKIAPKPNLEMEWIYDANERSLSGLGSIIEMEIDPSKHDKWNTYTMKQKILIGKIHQMEKLTRFKVNKIPVYEY